MAVKYEQSHAEMTDEGNPETGFLAKKAHAELLAEALQVKNLNTHQAAAYLNLSPNTLHRWRWSGHGPRFKKFGRSVRYSREDLDAYAEGAARDNTSAGVIHG